MTYLDDMRAACVRQLDWQYPRAVMYMSYYDGESAVMALLDSEERAAFRRFLDESQANWCNLIVNSVAERLQITGFRWGESSDTAWLIWQASQMDSDAELVQTDGLVTGQGFALVQPDDDNPSGVSISIESPLEATVLYKPGDRRERVAGFKRFIDLDLRSTEVLILPDVIATWSADDTSGDPVIEPNAAGVVGLVEIRPAPRTIGAPRSELDPAIPIANRIHTTIFNRLVATDYGAFRQIWATGVKLAREVMTSDDGTTTVAYVKPYDIGANRLLTNEDPNGKFGAFTESTLSGYLASVDQDVNHMAAITQTPPHYLLGRMTNLSADAITAAEAGLVSKVSRRALHIGEAWEEVMRIALGLVGDPGATDVEAEVIWRDFETRSQAQLADALTKMAALGVPTEEIWARFGATQQEIARWRQLKATEQTQTATANAAALGATDVYARALQGGTPPPPGTPPPTPAPPPPSNGSPA